MYKDIWEAIDRILTWDYNSLIIDTEEGDQLATAIDALYDVYINGNNNEEQCAD